MSDKITIESDCKPLPQEGYYECRVYLNVDREVARQINNVTYTLHPTFPDNVKKIEHDTGGKYMLKFTCWGEFNIRIDIEVESRPHPITKYHWLNLQGGGIS